MRNICKQPAGYAVTASLTDRQVSEPFSPINDGMGPIRLSLVLDAVIEATGITFKIRDSFDEGETYRDVGDQSQMTITKKTFSGGTAEVTTVNFADGSGTTQADYFVFVNQAGTTWAVWLDKAIGQVETVTCPAQAGAAQGDYIVVSNQSGTKWAFWIDIDDAGTEPTGAAYLAVSALNRVRLDVTTADTATVVGGLLAAAAAAVTDVTVTDNMDGTVEFAQDVAGACTDVARHNTGDTGNGSFTLAVDINGSDGGSEPTGAAYVAVSAPNRIKVDFSEFDLDEDIAALVVAATDGIFTDVTVLDNEDGTVTYTQDNTGATTNAAPHDANDGGAGSIGVTVDTAGSNGDVAISTNRLTSTSHGFITGDRVYLVGSDVPAGLTTATLYYVIKVDSNTVQLATSLENALAGTGIDLTDYGSGTSTLYQTVYEIRMIREDATDVAQLPITAPAIVTASTGSGDSLTVGKVWLFEGS